ncbi:MAG: peptide deformylase [Candidatus Omnitrophica bacterium]|nr:peptide deformylase [Candidatus Omnitrophota bacterium]
MEQLKLRIYPDPCLGKKAKEVEIFDKRLLSIVEAMSELMYINNGIGLAAPQVGLSARIITVDVGKGLEVMVNPSIVSRSEKSDTMDEGCLSLPGLAIKIARPTIVEVEGRDVCGNLIIKKCEGLLAKCIQHEIDHLEGKLLLDYLNPFQRVFAVNKKRSSQNKKL